MPAAAGGAAVLVTIIAPVLVMPPFARVMVCMPLLDCAPLSSLDDVGDRDEVGVEAVFEVGLLLAAGLLLARMDDDDIDGVEDDEDAA